MNTNDTSRHCTKCGAELVNGRCPKCLLQMAMPTGEAETMASPQKEARPTGFPQPGEQFGHYQIVRQLGAGGMGAVYEAEDIENGRRVALKVLSHSLDSPEARRRFFREGRMAASVNHPNSVYVFGTEEIAGTPCITMELVMGGTLQQRVSERGPLPIGEAVDAILQAIAGLEAAQQIGILHRDIKPSNCFVDADGAVKIGDFGLSLSTAVRTESNLTVEGAYLGTPAFSAPEQLRGEELTVRSDIYAVGVTLYYLLTGKMPFEAKHMVQLLATVLEKPAESPVKYRAGLPKALCAAVLRCLSKDPSARFKDYAELRAALMPFASTAPTPATLGRRVLAGFVDFLTWILFSSAIGTAVMMSSEGGLMSWSQAPLQHIAGAVSLLLLILYYAVPEGLRGASLGKWICGLRVVGSDRNVPGFVKAFARAGVYVAVPQLLIWIWAWCDPAKFSDPTKAWQLIGIAYSQWIVLALLFSTMRQRNGFAAVHDLLTGTRVINKPAYQARPVVTTVEETPTVTEATPKVGPYDVLKTLEKTDDGEWLLAYDGRLLRKVWLHVVPAGTPPVEAKFRALGRVGRLRWITGRRSEQENWDAFEGVTGQPLVSLLDKPQPWKLVRYWLLDLATEIAAAEKDGTLPSVLALDRVWITGDGRAKLLDFRAPGAPASSGPPPLNANAFLNEVARAAAEPVPVHARKFLDSMPGLPTAQAVAETLKPLLHKLAEVTRARRAVLLAGCIVFPVLLAGIASFSMRIWNRWQHNHPQVMEVYQLLNNRLAQRMGFMPKSVPKVEDRLFAIYIASHYRAAITNTAIWHSNIASAMITGENRQFAEKSLVDYPNPTSNEVAEAAETLKHYIPNAELKAMQEQMRTAAWMPLVVAGSILLVFVCWPAMFAALAFRGGLVMLICGVAVVRKDGRPASRGRIFWRSIVAWSPVWFGPILLGLLIPLQAMATRKNVPAPVAVMEAPRPVSEAEPTVTNVPPVAESTTVATNAVSQSPSQAATEFKESVASVMKVSGALVALLVLGVVGWSLALRDRSLQDRIAGTTLVPR
jgi:eukaryotic-like serine/threonine-protein kinase